MSKALATVGILSIGDMGLGVAKLLMAHKFDVITSVQGRSDYTVRRARDANIKTVGTDGEFVEASDYILSIVPPKDALPTASRISTALSSLSRPSPLFYLDLNAISPSTARHISSLFNPSTCHFLDGAIIGGPPKLRVPPSETATPSEVKNVTAFTEDGHAWQRPSIPLSGPVRLSGAVGEELANVLSVKYVGDEIGTASGLKCCFATMTKGYTALAIQAFTTASQLGVLDELKSQMQDKIPHMLSTASAGVIAMPPKAYRWVREMEEIADCHAEEGGFEEMRIFEGVAKVYEAVAADEVLGVEKTGERSRGRTVEDVAGCMGAGLRKRGKSV